MEKPITHSNRRVKEYGSVFVLSIVGSTILTYFACTSCNVDVSKFALTSFFSAVMWAVLWIGNGELASFLSTKFPWVKMPITRLWTGLISTVIFTTIAAIGLLKLWEYSRNIRFNDYSDFVIVSLIITFFISLTMHGREFLLQWRKSAVDAERYQKESMTATYESLKSQVNPHFLFNSLNALTNLVYEDQDKAAKFIKQLSEVYRYVLDTRDKELVPIADELRFLESYTYLQRIRFGDKLKIENTLDATQSLVAPLALQMLVENAVKHNEISQDKPLTIRLYRDGNFLIVENTLQRKLNSGEASSGMGLDNITKRYQFLDSRQVQVVEDDQHFVVKIPIINPVA
ncbi:histidine kinase [Chryseotalea sanaruensis]|nr:histidine kinase [Chryseotalea sanaruensis]